MADLAIDYSKAAVEALVANARSAIEEEEELWQSLQRDLVFIQDEFEMIQSFLSTADGERTKNNVVSTWVRHVCDLSYQVEDCAEFLSHLDTKRSWLALWLRFMRKSCCCCCMSAPSLDQAVAEIKLIKARVEEVSQRYTRYNLINDSAGTKPVVLVEHTGAGSTRKLDILIKARDAAKELAGFLDLSGLITKKDNALQVISVWGQGDDVGTKSIIKEAYDDPRVRRSFGRRAWVKLMHPFNPHEFMRSLLAQFSANNTDAPVADTGVEATNGADLPKQFGQQVNEQRYLVVLEDPSSVAELHDVRIYLQDKMNGSRIVVSTQHLDIAISSSGHPCHILELKQLSESNSVCVFFKEGLHRDELGYMCGPSFRPERPDYFVGPPQKSYFVGRNSLVSELSKMISSRKDNGKPCVVWVWGFSGIGKSALVSTVYRAMDKTFDQYAWVNVSHPINLVGLSWSILLNMLPESDRVEDPIRECRELLRRCNKYLLVIDGLQSKEDWDLINTEILCGCSGQGAPKPGQHQEFRRCIIVITDQNVANYPVSEDDAVCYVPGLQEDDAKSLFGQVVCGHTRSSVNKYMINEEAKPLLKKCYGFPKVITALALYLAHLLTRGDVQDSEGRRLNANFIHELETNQDLKDLFAYPQPQLLQKCFFYLSAFPLKSTIRRRRLVRRWIAEGYSKGIGSNSVEESADKLVDKLLLLGIIQPSHASPILSSAKRMTSCQVNSSFLEYIISRQMEESVFIPLEISVLKENCGPTTERVGQHLAIWRSWERDEFVFNSLDFSRLRSLTVYGKWQSFLISDKMRVLRVLDLEGSSDLKSSDLKEMVQCIPRLKFLSLRGCDNITYLPDSLGDLSQLQTLDIRGTSVGMLPKSIIKLRKLQYIRAGMPQKEEALKPPRNRRCASVSLLSKFCWHSTRNGGVKAPRGMGDMTALHTLGVVNASAAVGKIGISGILKELKGLTQMRKIGISGINNENIQHLFLAPHLASLSLHFHQENHAVRTADIDLPSKLRSLKLYGHVENLPRSIKDLHNLTKLRFDTITLKREDIQILGKIEKLRTLCLRVHKVQDDKIQFHARMDDGNGSSSTLFLKLQVLEIACSKFLHVIFDDGSVEKLELLAVRCYEKQLQFSGLEHLFSLKQIRLRGPYEDIIKEALQQQLANKGSNIPILKLEE